MPRCLRSALVVLSLGSSSLFAQALNIDHQPVACAVAERFALLEARFDPGGDIAAARVLFQPENGRDWYAVAMKAQGPAFHGVLPKPKKSLKAFRYYIEATDRALATSRTPEYTTRIVAGPGECPGKIMAAGLGSAAVLLQVPAGAAAVPAGFASTGIVAAGSSSAAAASTAAAGGGGGGGLSTGAWLGIAGGVGAAAAGVAIAAGGGASSDASNLIEIHGQVFAGPVGVNPVAGAIVSTSLDAASATTNGSGLFDLFTQATKTDDCRVFTITIRAAGYPTYSITAPWGLGNSVGGLIQFTLSPPWPDNRAIVKPQCPAG